MDRPGDETADGPPADETGDDPTGGTVSTGSVDPGEPADPADLADPVALARAYYRALDESDDDLLSGILAADFVHERPDQTLSGRERFVRFMREERPQTDTSHPIDGIYVPAGDDESADTPGASVETEVVVRGRLLAADGSEITAFADVFSVAEGKIAHLRTFTH